MSTMVIQECHLWLNLAEMKDVDKARFLDTPATLSRALPSSSRPLELLRPMLNRHLGRHVEPFTGERGSRRSDPDAGNPEMLEFALSEQCGAITGTWCFGTSASGGFESTGKRASSPLCRESLFTVWS